MPSQFVDIVSSVFLNSLVVPRHRQLICCESGCITFGTEVRMADAHAILMHFPLSSLLAPCSPSAVCPVFVTSMPAVVRMKSMVHGLWSCNLDVSQLDDHCALSHNCFWVQTLAEHFKKIVSLHRCSSLIPELKLFSIFFLLFYSLLRLFSE